MIIDTAIAVLAEIDEELEDSVESVTTTVGSRNHKTEASSTGNT
jgi:hypothetical protein